MRKLNIPFLIIILFLLAAALIEPASPFLVPYYDEETGIAKAEYYRYDDYSGFERHRPIYHYINTRGEIIRPR